MGDKSGQTLNTDDGHVEEVRANLKVELVGLDDELVMEYEKERDSMKMLKVLSEKMHE